MGTEYHTHPRSAYEPDRALMRATSCKQQNLIKTIFTKSVSLSEIINFAKMKRSNTAENEDEPDFRIYASSDDESPSPTPDNDPGYESGSSSSATPGEIPLTEQNPDGAEETIEASFEFYDPQPQDQSQISWYLREYIGSGDGDSRGIGNEIAGVISGQRRVGTMVRLGEGGEIVGVVSVLNCGMFEEVLKGLWEVLEKKGDEEFKKVVRGKEKVGLVVLERVVNLPGALVPSMWQALFDEVEWAKEDEPSQVLRDSFKFDWLMMISSCFVDNNGKGKEKGKGSGGGMSKSAKRRQKKRRKVDNGKEGVGVVKDNELAFARPEDEAWYMYSAHSLMWPMAKDTSTPQGLTKNRIAMLLPADKVKDMRERTRSLVVKSNAINGEDGAS